MRPHEGHPISNAQEGQSRPLKVLSVQTAFYDRRHARLVPLRMASLHHKWPVVPLPRHFCVPTI